MKRFLPVVPHTIHFETTCLHTQVCNAYILRNGCEPRSTTSHYRSRFTVQNVFLGVHATRRGLRSTVRVEATQTRRTSLPFFVTKLRPDFRGSRSKTFSVATQLDATDLARALSLTALCRPLRSSKGTEGLRSGRANFCMLTAGAPRAPLCMSSLPTPTKCFDLSMNI